MGCLAPSTCAEDCKSRRTPTRPGGCLRPEGSRRASLISPTPRSCATPGHDRLAHRHIGPGPSGCQSAVAGLRRPHRRWARRHPHPDPARSGLLSAQPATSSAHLDLPPIASMPVAYLTPAMEDCALQVQRLHAQRGHYRAPSIPHLAHRCIRRTERAHRAASGQGLRPHRRAGPATDGVGVDLTLRCRRALPIGAAARPGGYRSNSSASVSRTSPRTTGPTFPVRS